MLASRFKMAKIHQLYLFKANQAQVGTLYHTGIPGGEGGRHLPAKVRLCGNVREKVYMTNHLCVSVCVCCATSPAETGTNVHSAHRALMVKNDCMHVWLGKPVSLLGFLQDHRCFKGSCVQNTTPEKFSLPSC